MKQSPLVAMLSLCLSVAHPAFAQTAAPAADALQGKGDALYTQAPDVQAKELAELRQRLLDWAKLGRYRADNAALAPPAAGEQRVVFYGDSITDAWGRMRGTTFFPGKPYVNRGISGQTTAQMLVRFRQDVIDLKPAAVVILAGTNDLAGNTGLATQRMIEDNLRSMAELAQANHIKLVLASVLPVSDYPWRPGLQPAEKIRALNAWIEQYAQSHGAVYLDYYSKLRNRQGGMDKALSYDGVHPTVAGYALMAPLAQRALERALAQP
ncbi:capsular biosynthesis protein [Xanthomonas hyacinthi]|uniref:Capsular biosynthesis protein n=1 Tax=Xanthomonas hyacinthi TaxID=56455 RepID=A0A2S7EZ23_9XANT|nr:SGNH/GDSL hydrolase family protein [Xanthomonas hyacinthi]KLD77900.1 capsular biosynthesis protein [Xanthomonas hyacinthi DSM 19077]PPU98360.1 capsular biosynthesis protein [Xanthomonas hyacinthi]QGY78986.1 capsular biosynthesis protein [Xanthomonas hyacinthi]